MKPLNEKERTKMMIQFIGFFILALLFFVIPIVFAKKIQVKEKVAYQKTSIEYIQKDKLASKLDSAFSYLNDFKNGGSDESLKKSMDLIVALDNQGNSDSVANVIHFKTMITATRIIKAYYELVKKAGAERKESKDVQSMKADLDRLNNELRQCQSDYKALSVMHQ